MSFLPRLPASIRQFIAGFKIAAGNFFRKMTDKVVELYVRVRLILDKLMDRLPPKKRPLVLIASLGGFALLILIFAGSSLLARGNHERRKPAASEGIPARQGIIPPDDLFLPHEPDFVPGVLLEREQRAQWAAGDAEPLWQDPLKNGEEPWRNQIEKAIDEIMESVP